MTRDQKNETVSFINEGFEDISKVMIIPKIDNKNEAHKGINQNNGDLEDFYSF